MSVPKAPAGTLSVDGERTQVGHGQVWVWEEWRDGELVGAVYATPAAGVFMVPEEALAVHKGSSMIFTYGGTDRPVAFTAQVCPVECEGAERSIGPDGRSILSAVLPKGASETRLPVRASEGAAEIRVDLPSGEYALSVGVQVPQGDATYGFRLRAEG